MSCRDFWILTELGKLTSDSFLIVVEARVSKRYYTMGKRKEELLFFSFVALARARAI